MAFFSAESGTLAFLDGLTLSPRLPAGELAGHALARDTGDGILCMGAHPVQGGSLAPVCALDDLGLASVTLHTDRAGGTDKQRAFLFAALRLRDPCPDTRRCVRVRCAFGDVAIYTDPYTGGAAARLEYRRRDPEAQE